MKSDKRFSSMTKVLLVFFGAMAFASAAVAQVIDFANTTGYGLSTSRVMIEGIRVDTEIPNPFDPSHPTISTATFNVPFYFDITTLHLIPDLSGAVGTDPGTGSACANLNVHVSNAYSGSAISGALISVGSSSTYTDSNGQATLTGLVAGSVQLSGSASGFVSTNRLTTVSCGDNSVGLALSPSSGTGSVSAGELRIVLTWGENPRDLDSHLTGPDASNSGSSTEETNRFHVYYSHRTEDIAALDTDDTSSYGPETITISTLRPGLYRYSVHHYSGLETISASNAAVELWLGSTLYRTYTPPSGAAGSKDVWTVFELYINASGGISVYDIQSFANGPQSSAGSVRSTSTGYGSVETGVDFTRLPGK